MTRAEKAALRARAKKDYMDGMSFRQIAADYGVGIGSVSRWAEIDHWDTAARKKSGTPKRNTRPKPERKPEHKAERPPVKEDPPEIVQEITPEDLGADELPDYDLMRKTALLILAKINQRLLAEKPLEPRDIKSLTGALLDLKNQLNALSPRELKEMAARLRVLEKQGQAEEQSQEPVQVVFVNREWDNAGT
jgi:hypothetical protein